MKIKIQLIPNPTGPTLQQTQTALLNPLAQLLARQIRQNLKTGHLCIKTTNGQNNVILKGAKKL
jgi:hypothetical protein